MSPRWSVYGEAVADWRDEEMLNDCFAELIDESLENCPEFLNFLLDGLVSFDTDAEVVATDRDPLPYRDDGTNRKIDFTVADSEKIVGFESKRRDDLTENQLSDEREKLAYNADSRDVFLVALTESLSEPDVISRMDDDTRWMSWYSLSQRTFDANVLDDAWQPTVSRAKTMFREFGYREFSGIEEEEFRVTVWELWKQIATQVDSLETGQRWPYNLLKEVAGGSKGWKPIDPDWMLLTYGDESGNRPSKTCYALLSNNATGDIWIGLAIHPNGNEDLRDYMCESPEKLADRVLEEELEVIQFPLNWLVGRKNLPEDHQKAVTAERPSSRDELVDAFSDKRGMENDGANRFVLGFQVTSPDVLEESIQQLNALRDLFGDVTSPTLRQLVE